MTDKPMLMSFSRAAEVLKTCLIPENARAHEGFSSVCIDSREALPGSLFIALTGTVQDGHRYVRSAFDRGAFAALVSAAALEDASLGLKEAAAETGGILIPVQNTLAGFQRLAAAYLDEFPALLRIGITGSSGKTTTKEIAAAIIGMEKKTVMNQGNLNSETGLPLAVFEVRPFHEVGIFEMGMNRRGEIEELSRLLKPHVALITNIGSAHIGILGTKGAIAEEKRAIFSQFTGKETALVPENDEYSRFLSEGVNGNIVFYSPRSMKEFGGYTDLGLEGSEVIWEGVPVRFALPGRHNLANALAAAAIAREIPVSGEAVRRGFRAVKPLFGRSEIIKGPVTLIRDCYNANPEAMYEALAFCDTLEWPGRKVYVIGAMLELGDESPDYHRRLGELLSESEADMIFLFGEDNASALELLKEKSEAAEHGRDSAQPWFFHTSDMDELAEELGKYIREGDLVLLKGSRGLALERLMDVLSPEAARCGGGGI